MTQTESAFIPYQLGRHSWDGQYTPYEPLPIPGMGTVPATHPRLALIFRRIGEWFTEKGESWDERTYYVPPKPSSWTPSGDFVLRWGDTLDDK